MKLLIRFLNSALILQIITEETTSAHASFWNPSTNQQWRNLPDRILSQQDMFRRSLRSRTPRMMSIDLSQLMPGSSQEVPLRTRQKPPVNILGIDISVLSQKPDAKLPIVPSAFQLPPTRNMAVRDNFDPRYDRLPVVAQKPYHSFQGRYSNIPEWDTRVRNGLLHPFHHLPLNVVTTYHTVMENKNINQNVSDEDDEFEKDEEERKYTANFILHLLYQLSSNSQKKLPFSK